MVMNLKHNNTYPRRVIAYKLLLKFTFNASPLSKEWLYSEFGVLNTYTKFICAAHSPRDKLNK